MSPDLILTAVSLSCYCGIDKLGQPFLYYKYSKGSYEKSIADLGQRYERVKSMRGDVGHYLTEPEKQDVDHSIERSVSITLTVS